ncbi:MAG: hypothetical protein IKG01_11025 [Lachnospiraceae bacterium]|nr:hypothetical protein [Lachnospiraceae bacterium]
MRGLRIISRIYLSLAAIATAVLWFFPWVQVREGIAGGMSSLNSLIQLFITDAEQSAAVEKVLSKTGFSAFDLEKLCKSLLSFIGQANGTFLESVEDLQDAQKFLLVSRILLIALLGLAVFFGLRAMTNHCLGYIFFIVADVVALAGTAVTALTINDRIGADVLEFSYFFYVLVIAVILTLFFWVFAQISGLATRQKKLYVSDNEKRARRTVLIISILAFLLCCGGGAALYFVI